MAIRAIAEAVEQALGEVMSPICTPLRVKKIRFENLNLN